MKNQNRHQSVHLLDRREFTSIAAFGAASLAMGHAFAKATVSSDSLPMSWSDWGRLDATAMSELLASRQVSAQEVSAQCAAAVEALNPVLNCVVEVFDDVVDDPFSDGMNSEGSFSGVPMFVKDLGSKLKGRLQEKNSFFAKGFRAAWDDPLTRNFRRAGFNLMARTSIPSGALHVTEGLLTGISRNPWNTEHTPGGSSGGASASIASGIVPLSHCSDGGGSIRSPATLCGLMGLKGTRGLIPLMRGVAYDQVYFLMEGVITRTVRDQAAVYDEIMWHAPDDKLFMPIKTPDMPFAEQIRRAPGKLNIALSTGQWGRRSGSDTKRPVHLEIIERTRQVAAVLQSLGHTIVEVEDKDICDFGKLFDAFEWFYTYANDWAELSEATGVPINENTLEPAYIAMHEYQKSHPMPPGTGDRSRAANAELSEQWARFFAQYDLLLMPADVETAMKVKGPLSPFTELNNDAEFLNWVQDHLDDARYFIPANAIGLPAMAFPTGLLSNGLPAGAQLYGRWGADALTLQVAAQLERAKPEWFNRNPPVHVSNLSSEGVLQP